MITRMIGLSAIVLVACVLVPSEGIANDGYGLNYEITIVNNWSNNVRFKRSSANQDAKADIAPGQSQTFSIRCDSDQVFMAFGNKKLLGTEKFVPNKAFGGLSLSVSREGRLIIAVKSR
ncbi:hypothetical protein [Rhodopirellula baltica]